MGGMIFEKEGMRGIEKEMERKRDGDKVKRREKYKGRERYKS